MTVLHDGSSGALSAGPPSSQPTGRTDRSSHASGGGGDAVVPWKDYPYPNPHSSSGGGAGARAARPSPAAGRNDSSDSCGSGSGSNCSGGKITFAGTVVLRDGHHGRGRGQQGQGQGQAWERYRAPATQSQKQMQSTGPGLYEGYGYGGDDELWSTDHAAAAATQRLTPTRDGGDLVLRVEPMR
ncbi:hypothetical protein BKA80DRAFT_283793 [Phyllosticta citrichinensis]